MNLSLFAPSPARLASSLLLLCNGIHAQLELEWTANAPVGSALSSGMQAFVVDGAGNTYLTGVGGPSSNTDVVTVSFDPQGNLRWRQDFNGPGNWHDQGRGITLAPGGVLWVTGNTPAASKHSNVLLVAYDASSGAQLDFVQWSSGFGIAEYGASVVADALGNVYVTGGTVGDGGDVLTLAFDPQGALRWRRTWDGAALAPYSQDQGEKILLDPDGNVDVLIHGVAADLQPDFYLLEYDASSGETLFEATWGTRGGDYVEDMEIDAAGDVFVTGTGLDFTNKYSTVKFDGASGGILWQRYDSAAVDDRPRALVLDAAGDAYVTGSVDPDGDISNFNDDIYTVKIEGGSGSLLWSRRYGDPCKRCFDVPSDLVPDSAGNLFLAGTTSSAPYSGQVITFVLDAATGAETLRAVLEGGAGTGVLGLDAAENLYNGGGTYDPNTGAVTMSTFKYTGLVASRHALNVESLVAGGSASFLVTNATPLAMQYVAYSLGGTGSFPIPQLGVTLGLASPRLLFAQPANAAGEMSRSLAVPPGVTGLAVWMQTAEQGSVTDVVAEVIR